MNAMLCEYLNWGSTSRLIYYKTRQFSHENCLYSCKFKTKRMKARRLPYIVLPCKIAFSIVITFKTHDVPVTTSPFKRFAALINTSRRWRTSDIIGSCPLTQPSMQLIQVE